MALYEIRTSITRHRTSLVSFAEFPNDLTAILAARDLARRGETIEVWREAVLVYRSGALAHSLPVLPSNRKP